MAPQSKGVKNSPKKKKSSTKHYKGWKMIFRTSGDTPIAL
jgi:hypothetical protein